jgi:hypothetical protein
VKNKAVKIVLDVVASVVVLFVATLLVDWITGAIFGSTKGFNNTNSGVIVGTGFLLTLVFAVWFYKFLGRKSKVVKE